MAPDVLQGCLIITRLIMAAATSDIVDDQSLSFLYKIMADDSCHPDHFETLATPVAVYMQAKKVYFVKSVEGKQQPVKVIQRGVAEITLWQGKPLPPPIDIL